MATITGPDFIALQVSDLERSARFYSEVLGLAKAPQSPPDAVVFLTSPISFAVRKPLKPLEKVPLGHGFVLWLQCDDLDEFQSRLNQANASIVDGPAQGPFGKTLRFKDPDGYIVTLHEKAPA